MGKGAEEGYAKFGEIRLKNTACAGGWDVRLKNTACTGGWDVRNLRISILNHGN
jgi:hypothetical protein